MIRLLLRSFSKPRDAEVKIRRQDDGKLGRKICITIPAGNVSGVMEGLEIAESPSRKVAWPGWC
jgi:hypothetical protein